METVDGVNSEIAKIFSAKQQRRQKLAHLAFPDKVHAVIQLQNMTAANLRSRGKLVRSWATLGFASGVTKPGKCKIPNENQVKDVGLLLCLR